MLFSISNPKLVSKPNPNPNQDGKTHVWKIAYDATNCLSRTANNIYETGPGHNHFCLNSFATDMP